MKVLALILALIGVGGASAVAAPPAPSTVTPQNASAAPVRAAEAPARHPRVVVRPDILTPATAVVKVKKKTAPVAVKKVVTKHTATKKTTTKKKAPAPSNGKCGASCQWHKTDAVWAKYPAWVQTFALCVSHHESWSPHMWTAENPISTASGGFQWIDGSWRVNMKRAGFSGPGHAAHASPVLQAEVTAWVITHNGQRNWKGTHCGFGT